jgi:hypothetical protein
MSLERFLDWEARYEFDGVRPVVRNGDTRAHAEIQGNLAVALGMRLRSSAWGYFTSILKIEVAGRVRYPDGFVAHASGRPGDTIVRDPVVIFEVLGEGTASIDLVVRNREYAAAPSVRRYVILAQDFMGGLTFERQGKDWIGHVLGPDSLLAMPEIDIEVPLVEVYEGMDLPPLSREDQRPA